MTTKELTALWFQTYNAAISGLLANPSFAFYKDGSWALVSPWASETICEYEKLATKMADTAVGKLAGVRLHVLETATRRVYQIVLDPNHAYEFSESQYLGPNNKICTDIRDNGIRIYTVLGTTQETIDAFNPGTKK
jgi:hypothetical protein